MRTVAWLGVEHFIVRLRTAIMTWRRFFSIMAQALDVSEPERNPLFGAILKGHTGIAKLLVDRGIDINVQYTGESMKDMDALAFAREWGRSDIAEYLLAHGAVASEGPHRWHGGARDEIIAYFAGRFGPVDPISAWGDHSFDRSPHRGSSDSRRGET